MLALKMGIAYAIPDTPVWVEKEMAKIEYKRRELEKSVAVSNSSFGSSPPTPAGSLANSMDTEERAVQTEDATTAARWPQESLDEADVSESSSRYTQQGPSNAQICCDSAST